MTDQKKKDFRVIVAVLALIFVVFFIASFVMSFNKTSNVRKGVDPIIAEYEEAMEEGNLPIACAKAATVASLVDDSMESMNKKWEKLQEETCNAAVEQKL